MTSGFKVAFSLGKCFTEIHKTYPAYTEKPTTKLGEPELCTGPSLTQRPAWTQVRSLLPQLPLTDRQAYF